MTFSAGTVFCSYHHNLLPEHFRPPKRKPHTHQLIPLPRSSVQWLSCVRLFAAPWTAATPGLPVHHRLPEFTQTHVHWVGDAIQPSHPPLSPSSPAFNLSQYQESQFFKWVSSSHQVAKVLEFPPHLLTTNLAPVPMDLFILEILYT